MRVVNSAVVTDNPSLEINSYPAPPEQAVGAFPLALSLSRRKRGLFALYLLLVAAYSIRTGAFQARTNHAWMIGDWLINYSGGFVRRGLTGSLTMVLHRATGIPLEWGVFSIQTSVFLLFLACVYKLSQGIRWSWLMAAALLSPATLACTVLDGGYGFRKEILLFAALALTLCVLHWDRLKDWQFSTMLSVMLVGMALSHEGLLVAAPYFFAAVAIQTSSLRRAARICTVPFILTGIALVPVIMHHGDYAVAQAICSSVGGQMAKPGVVLVDGGVCTGAISALQITPSAERASVIQVSNEFHQVRLYCLLAIPTFVPLVALLSQFYRRNRLRFEIITLLGCTMLSLAGTAVLFYIGTDWGRWIHMQAICLLLLVMLIDRKTAAVGATEAPARHHSLGFHAIATLALIVYATTWTLPAWGYDRENPGYLPVVWPTYRNSLHHFRLAVAEEIRRPTRIT